MGIWRFAGAFAVVERQSECGSKDRGMHVSQPMNIERVLGGRFFLVIYYSTMYSVKHFLQTTEYLTFLMFFSTIENSGESSFVQHSLFP